MDLEEALTGLSIRAGHRVALVARSADLHVAMHRARLARHVTPVLVPPDLPAADRGAWMAKARPDGCIIEAPLLDVAHPIEGPHVVVDAPEVEGGEGTRARRYPIVTPDGTAPPGEGGTTPGPTGDGSVIIATSGTGGAPGQVTLTGPQMAAHAQAACARIRCGPDAVSLLVLPPWHVGGVAMIDRWLRGYGRLVAHDRFDVDAVAAALDGVTHISLVPTMLRRLVTADVRPPASLACVLVGGDRLPADLLRAARAAGWPVWPTYGLTEAASQVATATPEEADRFPDTSGAPLDGVQITIVDGDGMTVPEGTAGQIVVAGPTVSGGRVRTDDLGRMEAGRLYVTGRMGDRIVSGGKKVDPARVEAVLEDHAAVAQACVVGAPDAEWGERVEAVVVWRQAAARDAVLTHCRNRLAPHEVPKAFHDVAALPRTANGKLMRAAVRRRLQDATR